MRILDFFTRLMHRADRFETMADRLGVAEDLENLSDHAGVVSRAVDRCLRVGLEKNLGIAIPCETPCQQANVGDHDPRLG